MASRTTLLVLFFFVIGSIKAQDSEVTNQIYEGNKLLDTQVFDEAEMVFWGWQRDNKELNKLFLKNGFVLEKNYACVGQSFSFYTQMQI